MSSTVYVEVVEKFAIVNMLPMKVPMHSACRAGAILRSECTVFSSRKLWPLSLTFNGSERLGKERNLYRGEAEGHFAAHAPEEFCSARSAPLESFRSEFTSNL